MTQFDRKDYSARLRPDNKRKAPPANQRGRRLIRGVLSRRNVMQYARGLNRETVKETRPHLQQSVVKVSYRSSRYAGQWEAHGRYLEREGAQQEGSRGTGFNAREEQAPIAERLKEWQAADDAHMFRMIVSPEQGDRLDMRAHARQLVSRMEQDLGTNLEWVAIEHINTDNPHVHIAIRGRDDQGKTLFIPKHYIQHGIRERSREEATRTLGPRLEKDMIAARAKAVQAKRVTELDRMLEQRRDGQGKVEMASVQRETDRQLLGRLQFLKEVGLAKKTGAWTWQLSENLIPALRQYQNSQDIVKRRAQHMSNIMDTRSPLVVTDARALQARGELTGRVVGSGLDDALQDRRYLLLEATDGKIHYLPLPRGLERRVEEKHLAGGDLITLRAREFEKEGQSKPIRYIAIDHHGKMNARELLPIDRDIVAGAREGLSLTIQGDGMTRFQQHYNELIKARMEHLRAHGVLDKQDKVNEAGWRAYREAAKTKEHDRDNGR